MIAAEVLDALLAAGATAEMIVAAVKADAAIYDEKAEHRRAANAERQRRHRERNAVSRVTDVTNGDERDEARPLSPLPPQTPLTPHTPTRNSTPARKGWACPAGVEQRHWDDFKANRKAKRLACTETAYLGQLRELAKWSDAEWPPGRVMQHVAEQGWGGIYDPRGKNGGNNVRQRREADGLGRTARAAIAVFGHPDDDCRIAS